MQEKSYVGIDMGKKCMQIVRIKDNKQLEWKTCKTDRKGRHILLNWLKKTDVIALEAGNLSFLLAKQIIKNVTDQVIVLNPGDLATIYMTIKKTDKEDALKLARLVMRFSRDELPEVSIPSDREQMMRRLSSEQKYWQTNRTKGINRLHSVYTQAGITNICKKDLKTEKNRNTAVIKMPEIYQIEIERLLAEIQLAEKILKEIDDQITKALQVSINNTKTIMSIPGMGPINALAILAFIGNGDRFSSAKQVSNYVGLVPKVDISGQSIHYGRIIKRGCGQVKGIIIQAAWALVRSKYGGELTIKYDELRKRKGKKKAIVAIARKMIELVYHLLKTNQLYNNMPDDVLQKKLKYYGLTA